jgi:hypothetical protein
MTRFSQSCLAMAFALLPQQAGAEAFQWVQSGPGNPTIWYNVSTADKNNNTVSVMVAYMRRAASPATPGNAGSMKTEMIFCGRGGYEDTHQDVDGSMHESADSFRAFDFKAPGPMEDISRAVCPKG